ADHQHALWPLAGIVARGLGDLDLVEHVVFATDRVGGDADETADFGLDDHSGGSCCCSAIRHLNQAGGPCAAVGISKGWSASSMKCDSGLRRNDDRGKFWTSSLRRQGSHVAVAEGRRGGRLCR